GIGIQVGMEEEEITIFTVMENSPASRSGLLVGDKIIEINGNSLKNKNTNDIQEYLLLPVGSEVILKVKRFDEEEPLDYTLTTEEILVKNIPYFGFVGEGTGYIKLSKFTRNSGYDVKEAIISLKTNELNGLILDLRGNPGGLLDEAIEVLSNFLPQNELVVYTQNEKDEVKSKYFTKNTPVYLEKPLIVLVDEGSASASEIVAGAIQDLDRGIILGEVTFGKGLVQSEVPLTNGNVLKITTAKYFIPSGRCVQKTDYFGNNKIIKVLNNVAKEQEKFTTTNGRIVYEGGGIYPDVVSKQTKESKLITELRRKGMFAKFTADFILKNPQANVLPENTELSFSEYLEKNNFHYSIKAEKKIEELKNNFDLVSIDSLSIASKLNEITSLIRQSKKNEISFCKNEVLAELKKEFLSIRFSYESRLEFATQTDAQVILAKNLLKDQIGYRKRLLTATEIGQPQSH
ncbi:S41 family peptidase, partial [bacterium]|nr:S41 family peptidase [bacterium]